jgi:hypothetical protein
MADTTAIAEQLCSSSTIKLLPIVLIEMRRRGTEIWRQSDGMKVDEFRPFSEEDANLPLGRSLDKLFLEFSLSQFDMVEVRSLPQEKIPQKLSKLNEFEERFDLQKY